MKKYKAKIKQEFMDLIGEISVDELIGNTLASDIIQDIVSDLKTIPRMEHYRFPQGRRL